MMDGKLTFTRAQLFDLIQKKPELDTIITSFSCMVGDDLYTIPRACVEGTHIDERQFINHSCEPNSGYAFLDGVCSTIAIRDIEAGEELTYHYGMLETEASLTFGHECMCGSKSCSGKWTFDLYRKDNNLMRFAKPELQQKAEDLRQRWHSGKCYVKRVPCDDVPVTQWFRILVSLRAIKEGELVARFGDNHFIRTSDDANCYLADDGIFAKYDILADVEITIAEREQKGSSA
jgi:hypothetical protein